MFFDIVLMTSKRNLSSKFNIFRTAAYFLQFSKKIQYLDLFVFTYLPYLYSTVYLSRHFSFFPLSFNIFPLHFSLFHYLLFLSSFLTFIFLPPFLSFLFPFYLPFAFLSFVLPPLTLLLPFSTCFLRSFRSS